MNSPRQRSQFYGQTGPSHRVNNMRSMNKRPSSSNYVGMDHQMDSYHLGGGGAPALGGNINMITQNFLQNIQNPVPTIPCQMSLNGQSNSNQINQLIDLDPSRNINQLINIGKFGNLDLNGLAQNALHNAQAQPQEHHEAGAQHGGQPPNN